MEVLGRTVFLDLCYPETIKTLSNYADIEVRLLFDVMSVR